MLGARHIKQLIASLIYLVQAKMPFYIVVWESQFNCLQFLYIKWVQGDQLPTWMISSIQTDQVTSHKTKAKKIIKDTMLNIWAVTLDFYMKQMFQN